MWGRGCWCYGRVGVVAVLTSACGRGQRGRSGQYTHPPTNNTDLIVVPQALVARQHRLAHRRVVLLLEALHRRERAGVLRDDVAGAAVVYVFICVNMWLPGRASRVSRDDQKQGADDDDDDDGGGGGGGPPALPNATSTHPTLTLHPNHADAEKSTHR